MFTSREPTGLRFVWHRHLRGSSGAIISLEGGLILSQGSGVGIRACANARATLEVICGLSLVTTAQRFPFYFHPPETVLQCDRAGFDPKSNNPALSIPFRPPGW